MNHIYNIIRSELAPLYGVGEASAIARLVMEVKYEASMVDILTKDITGGLVPAEVGEMLEHLKAGEPVQYVLGEAAFCGHRIEVGPGVLIPRPETEWLVTYPLTQTTDGNRQQTTDNRRRITVNCQLSTVNSPLRILDLCTGSGCIALALKKQYPDAEVEAWDVSPEALAISRRNFAQHGLTIKTRQVDILRLHLLTSPCEVEKHIPMPEECFADESAKSTFATGKHRPQPGTPPLWESGEGASLIVSNPPYVLDRERADMAQHVLKHEPALALFVPDDDPMLFYRALARIGQQLLCAGGELRVECNTAYVNEVAALFQSAGFDDVETHEDCFGKPRFVNCKRQKRD